MKTIMLSVALFISNFGFADQISDLQSFFTASTGVWSGSGQGQKPGKEYPITVQQTVSKTAAFAWNFESSITNELGNPVASLAAYEITTGGLYINLPQAQVLVDIQMVTPLHLVMSFSPNAATSVVRDMALTSPTTMTVISEVYQNGSLFQNFQYQLQKH